MTGLTDYQPGEILNFYSKHTMRLRFLYGEATGEVIVEIGGNMCGGEILECYTNFRAGLSADSKNPINQHHCVFETEDGTSRYREVERIHVYHPTRGKMTLDLEEAQKYLVAAEIIGFSVGSDEEDEEEETE